MGLRAPASASAQEHAPPSGCRHTGGAAAQCARPRLTARRLAARPPARERALGSGTRTLARAAPLHCPLPDQRAAFAAAALRLAAAARPGLAHCEEGRAALTARRRIRLGAVRPPGWPRPPTNGPVTRAPIPPPPTPQSPRCVCCVPCGVCEWCVWLGRSIVQPGCSVGAAAGSPGAAAAGGGSSSSSSGLGGRPALPAQTPVCCRPRPAPNHRDSDGW